MYIEVRDKDKPTAAVIAEGKVEVGHFIQN